MTRAGRRRCRQPAATMRREWSPCCAACNAMHAHTSRQTGCQECWQGGCAAPAAVPRRLSAAHLNTLGVPRLAAVLVRLCLRLHIRASPALASGRARRGGAEPPKGWRCAELRRSHQPPCGSRSPRRCCKTPWCWLRQARSLASCWPPRAPPASACKVSACCRQLPGAAAGPTRTPACRRSRRRRSATEACGCGLAVRLQRLQGRRLCNVPP